MSKHRMRQLMNRERAAGENLMWARKHGNPEQLRRCRNDYDEALRKLVSYQTIDAIFRGAKLKPNE